MCEAMADDKTFLYFDPPYRPLTKTSSFTSYTKEGFDDNDLTSLFDLYKRLNKKGCLLMLSNSGRGGTPDEDYIEVMFEDFDVDNVKAKRAINSKGNSRGEVNEVIVKNALTNDEVISTLSGLMIPEKRYTSRELAELLFNHTRLSSEDLSPMPSEGVSSPRYTRMVKNALRYSPDSTSHPSNTWVELKIDHGKSTNRKNVYYLKPKKTTDDAQFEVKVNEDTRVLFGKGRIDDWCVYIEREGKRRAPKDTEYFQYLHLLSTKVGVQKVYTEFCEMWARVTNVPESSMHTLIDELISTHPAEFQMESKLWYSVLYMAMVSEENYRNTKLGKRLKRLGVHQFLIEGMPVVDAANWSRGKRWREIAAECEKFGF